jgi:putative oxidoreductase
VLFYVTVEYGASSKSDFVLFIIFTGALIEHVPNGWTMNWFGDKKGEGIEYHLLLLSLLLAVIIKGSGALSIDLWLITRL